MKRVEGESIWRRWSPWTKAVSSSLSPIENGLKNTYDKIFIINDTPYKEVKVLHRIISKYSGTLTPYHTCLNILTRAFNYILV